MVIRERRCAKCHTRTGVRPDGAFTPYTLYPFFDASSGTGVEHVAVFCAPCFEALGDLDARDAAAAAAIAPAEREPKRELAFA